MSDSENRDSNLRKAYTKATQDLREKYREDFETFYSKRAAELGETWVPKPTAEQKAAQELEAILAQYPHLAADIHYAAEEPEVVKDDEE